jgi:hypothetical protein
MGTTHSWVLWRLLMIGLIALPLLVVVVVEAFRQRYADGSSASAEHDDRLRPRQSRDPTRGARKVTRALRRVPSTTQCW